MNIRSMIKHVAAIITAVGMLLASMAGAVTALAEDSKPTTAVDGPTKPVRIMDNLYQTRYTGDYKLDDYLSANAGGNDDYLAWLRANLNHGKPIPLSTTQACTTLAVTDTDTGHDLMVRNMDWYPAVPRHDGCHRPDGWVSERRRRPGHDRQGERDAHHGRA